MPDLKLVTFTSDFGWQSEAIGVMEATVIEICPEVRTVHLSHGVEPFSTVDGARQLECVTTIAKGIHVCVVDPGVGGSRKGLVLKVPKIGYLVGPDNGVLLPAARLAGGISAARWIENLAIFRHPVSSTFHGRDIFAATAGHLARGVAYEEVGTPVDERHLVPASYEDARLEQGRIKAKVIHVNRFGNCIFNIQQTEVSSAGTLSSWTIETSKRIYQIAYTAAFSLVDKQEPLLYPDSYGRIGLALNQGNAARSFNLNLGSELILDLIQDKSAD